MSNMIRVNRVMVFRQPGGWAALAHGCCGLGTGWVFGTSLREVFQHPKVGVFGNLLGERRGNPFPLKGEIVGSPGGPPAQFGSWEACEVWALAHTEEGHVIYSV